MTSQEIEFKTFKTQLPSEFCIEPIQKNLFKLGFTWEDKTSKVIPWNEISKYYLFIDMNSMSIKLIHKYNSQEFFNYSAQYIDYGNLLYGIDRFKRHPWDQQQYENMVYWYQEGYKYEL